MTDTKQFYEIQFLLQKFSGASFGGGIVIGVGASIVVVLILYFLKCRKSEVEYNRLL
jgi:hypothetical protein